MNGRKFLAAVLLTAGVANAQAWHEPTDEELKAGYDIGDGITMKTSKGLTWVTVHPNGKFAFAYVVSSRTVITGEFRTILITALPPSDIVGAPDRLVNHITGDCKTRTYTSQGIFTMNGDMPNNDQVIPEYVRRRVLPDTPMDVVFSMCADPSTAKPPVPSAEAKALMDKEEDANDKCRGGSGDGHGTYLVCDVRDKLLESIHALGWCWGHDGQVGSDRKWESCPAKGYFPANGVPLK